MQTIAAGSPLGTDIRDAMTLVAGDAVSWADAEGAAPDAAAFDSVPGVGFDTNPVAAGIKPPAGQVIGNGPALIVEAAQNNAFRAVNAAWRQGGHVTTADDGYAIGGLSKTAQDALVSRLALQAKRGRAGGVPIAKPRIGLYRPWSPNIDEGWTRWVLEMYEFDFVNIRNAEMKAGDLRGRYDVILLADMGSRSILQGAAKGTMPRRYTGGIGSEGVRALDRFVQDGGTLVTLNNSSLFAIDELHLKVVNVVEDLEDTAFFSSGSILETIVNEDHSIMAGMPSRAKITVTSSPVFTTTEGFEGSALLKFADHGSPLLSGFLLGEEHLHGFAAALDVEHGKGNVILMGLRPQWRGQPFGTFRMLFNALYYTGAVRDAETDAAFWTAPPVPEAEKNGKEGDR